MQIRKTLRFSSGLKWKVHFKLQQFNENNPLSVLYHLEVSRENHCGLYFNLLRTYKISTIIYILKFTSKQFKVAGSVLSSSKCLWTMKLSLLRYSYYTSLYILQETSFSLEEFSMIMLMLIVMMYVFMFDFFIFRWRQFVYFLLYDFFLFNNCGLMMMMHFFHHMYWLLFLLRWLWSRKADNDFSFWSKIR